LAQRPSPSNPSWQLKWTETEPGEDCRWKAEGDNKRFYRIWMVGEKWLAGLVVNGSPVISRGWARTLDQAKRIAEEWEQSLRKYEMPQVEHLWVPGRPDFSVGFAWIRPDGGPTELLPLKDNNPYETARDAARNATGLGKIMWTAWGGRGKTRNTEDAEVGRIIWDSIHLNGVEYGFVYPNGNPYTSAIDLIAQAKSRAADLRRGSDPLRG
jgi:hypothetical protein